MLCPVSQDGVGAYADYVKVTLAFPHVGRTNAVKVGEILTNLVGVQPTETNKRRWRWAVQHAAERYGVIVISCDGGYLSPMSYREVAAMRPKS
jgi:hypothetical protein